MAIAALLASPSAQAAEGTEYQAPVESGGGVVASISDDASAVGIDVLDRGGNAVDAAVAMVFAVGVARPHFGGIGGGGHLVYRGHNRDTAALDFRETAPAAVEPDTYTGSGMHKDPGPFGQVGSGHMVVGAPGVVAGMAEALRQLGSGKFTLGELIMNGGVSDTPYAYELARDGIHVTAEMRAWFFWEQNRLNYYPATQKIYAGKGFPDDNLKQDDYAKSLLLIAKHGEQAFYQDLKAGPDYEEGESIAGLIADDMAKAEEASKTNPVLVANSPKWGGTPNDKGLLTLADLSAYRPVWRTPLVAAHGDAEIIAMPPPSSGGIATIETLNLIEGFPIGSNTLDPGEPEFADSSWAQSSANHLHVLAEGQKIAWADRNKYVADPDFLYDYDGDGVDEPVPTQRLTSEEYAAERRGEIDLDEAKFDYEPGELGTSHTNHLSVIDRKGNAIAVTSSIGNGFGSAVVAEGTGFLLADELTDFNMDDPGTANEPNGGKRLRSSQSPTIVVKDRRPVLVVGGAGGPTIPMGVIQAIVNLTGFPLAPLDVAHALDAERIEARFYGDRLGIEDTRVKDAVETELKSRGHSLERRGEGDDYDNLPIINAVGFNLASGCREAVSDPRNDGPESIPHLAAGQDQPCSTR